jgi:hypothetical protein
MPDTLAPTESGTSLASPGAISPNGSSIDSTGGPLEAGNPTINENGNVSESPLYGEIEDPTEDVEEDGNDHPLRLVRNGNGLGSLSEADLAEKPEYCAFSGAIRGMSGLMEHIEGGGEPVEAANMVPGIIGDYLGVDPSIGPRLNAITQPYQEVVLKIATAYSDALRQMEGTERALQQRGQLTTQLERGLSQLTEMFVQGSAERLAEEMGYEPSEREMGSLRAGNALRLAERINETPAEAA